MPTTDIQSFSVLVPRQSNMKVNSSVLAPNDLGGAPDPQYAAMMSTEALKAGVPFAIEVTGLPEGRGRIWIVGGSVAALLVLVAGFFAWRTRPKVTEDAAATALVA